MLTVGFVKELFFIAHVLNDTFVVKLYRNNDTERELRVEMTPAGHLSVHYCGQHIWSEHVEGDTSFFGIESCDTIARIMSCIEHGTDWSQYRWNENP